MTLLITLISFLALLLFAVICAKYFYVILLSAFILWEYKVTVIIILILLILGIYFSNHIQFTWR